MHIQVKDFLAESVGYNRSYQIKDEHLSLETVHLVEPISGELTITRLEDNLMVRGHLATVAQLECHRCLRTFDRPVRLAIAQVYSQHPGDDELPIIDATIDLAPMIEQEIILSLPIKILHAPDCAGLEDTPEQYANSDSSVRLQHQARITKGNPRGRTKETHHQ
jgi:uncharacterized protein